MPNVKKIAVDGPAASGKSTIGVRLARELDFLFLDSGTLYRAIAFWAVRYKLNLHDSAAIAEAAHSFSVDIVAERGKDVNVLINGYNINGLLYTPAVDRVVAITSAYPAVRQRVRELQHTVIQQGNIVMAGRDIGTVIMPDAKLKIFLQPSLEVRARRRCKAAKLFGEAALQQMMAELSERDRLDSERAESPMRIAEDALVINSDGMYPNQVVGLIMRHARQHGLIE
jgi:cytidylate kinase